MCFCVFLASDHPFPLTPLVCDELAFKAEPLRFDHPVKKWLTKPHQVHLGSRTGCACGLNFNYAHELEHNIPPPFTDEFTEEMWADALQEHILNKKCLEDYYAYLRNMLALGDLEWYCCWDGNWDIPPVLHLQLPASALADEPDFSKDHLLEEGLFVYYQAEL